MSLTHALPMLEGVKVVDLTSVVFGPYSTQILADFGAEVVKVEPKIGDAFRYSQKPAKSRGMSPGHMSLNRGKKSVVLNLKAEEDAEIMREMIKDCDIFIHNVRDKAIKRLGLGYDDVKAINPEIIYVHCVGFGSGGPYSDLQAYDDVIQAATGTTSLLSRVDGNPEPRFFPSLIADKVAGLNGAYATLAAVIHKLRTGKGQFVEVPMFEAFAHFMLKEHLAGKTFDPPNGTACYSRQVDPRRQPFETADGYIVIVPYTNESWDAVYDVLGAPEFLQQEQFQTPIGRVKNQDALYEGIKSRTPTRTTGEWLEALRARNIPCMPVRDIEDILDDPHLTESGFLNRREHPTEGAYYELSEASRYSDWSPEPAGPAPTIGAHNDEIKSRYSTD
eukprot:g3378.t1